MFPPGRYSLDTMQFSQTFANLLFFAVGAMAMPHNGVVSVTSFSSTAAGPASSVSASPSSYEGSGVVSSYVYPTTVVASSVFASATYNPTPTTVTITFPNGTPVYCDELPSATSSSSEGVPTTYTHAVSSYSSSRVAPSPVTSTVGVASSFISVYPRVSSVIFGSAASYSSSAAEPIPTTVVAGTGSSAAPVTVTSAVASSATATASAVPDPTVYCIARPTDGPVTVTIYPSTSAASGVVSSYFPSGTASGVVSSYIPGGTASGVVSSYIPGGTASGVVSSYFPSGTASGVVSSYIPGGTASGVSSSYVYVSPSSASSS